MWTHSEVAAKLGLERPIIQGPFGGGLSTPELVAAVSNAGGLGSFGAHMLDADGISSLVEEIRSLTERPFAINLWVDDLDESMASLTSKEFEERRLELSNLYAKLGAEPPVMPQDKGSRFASQVEAILDTQPASFSFVFGIPSAEILAACRERGIVTIGAATTVDEAVAIEAAGVDMVVATGFEAGGHRPSFLDSAEASLMGTLALVPLVRDAVRIPVIAAGGIGDARGMKAAFALGADAVQLGTAFLACEESGASVVHKEKLLGQGSRRTVLSRSFTGRLARYLPNGFIDDFDKRGLPALPFPAQSWLTGPLKQRARELGDVERTALYASQATPLLKHRSAVELFSDLVSVMNGEATEARDG